MRLLWWRQLVLRRARHKGGAPTAAFDMDEIIRQYLTGLSCPACAYLSPRHVLRLVPAQPRSVGSIWQEAIYTGMMPQSVSLEAFSEALVQLSPLLLSVTTAAPPCEKQQDMVVGWQPWVPQEWRTHGGSSGGAEVKWSALESELCEVVPTYFVATSLVRDQLRLQHIRATGGSPALEWHQLASPPLASLLEWSSDHSIVRLSGRGANSSAADSLYNLHSQPELYHQALKALALLLPTYKVAEERLRRAYHEHFVDTHGAYHLEFGSQFFARFPDARGLTGHPDMQFAMQRDDPDCMMLHPCFLHPSRGVADLLYKVALPYSGSVSETKEVRWTPVCRFLHASLPYMPRNDDEVMLRHIQDQVVLGVHCVIEGDKDCFHLTVSTVDGAVCNFKCTVSSLSHLAATGVPNGGLPSQVTEVLTSPRVVKIIALNSKNAEERVSEERHFVSLLRRYLHVSVQTVCSLWRWALFVGFPIRLPSEVSLSFYRCLLTRLTITADPFAPTAFMAAMCASRLLALHEADGYCFDAATLQKMLHDEAGGEEAWLLRNLQLRIGRYGDVPWGGANRKACELFLHHLTSLYGPEVCILSGKGRSPLTTAASCEEVRGAQWTSEEVDEQEYADALCGATSMTGSEQRHTVTMVGEVAASSRETVPEPPAKQQELNEAIEKDEGQQEKEEEKMFSAMFGDSDAAATEGTPVPKEPSMATVSSRSDSVHTGVPCGAPNFLLSPPAVRSDDGKYLRRNGRCGRLLPPPFSVPRVNASAKCVPNTQSDCGAAITECRTAREQREVKGEEELIGRLTREILEESRRPFREHLQAGHTFDGVTEKQTMGRIRDLLSAAHIR